MYLSEDEAKDRLSDPRNLSNVVVEHKRRSGRPPGTRELSPAAREIIARAARVLPPKKVAETFGITRRHASNLSRGISSNEVSGRQRINEELKEALESKDTDRVSQIREQALDVLFATVNGLDSEAGKLGAEKRARVAKEMATIYEKLGDKGPGDQVTKVLIYAPQQRSMKDYEEPIDVEAKEVG